VGETVKILAIAEHKGNVHLCATGDGQTRWRTVKVEKEGILSQALSEWLGAIKGETPRVVLAGGQPRPPFDAVVIRRSGTFLSGLWYGVIGASGCPMALVGISASKAQLSEMKLRHGNPGMTDGNAWALLTGISFIEQAEQAARAQRDELH
jgi:hypothetical protein